MDKDYELRIKRYCELFHKGIEGIMTGDEEDEYYLCFMNNIEKIMRKPLYKMDNFEWNKYLVLDYNSQSGTVSNPSCPICKGKGLFKEIRNDYIFTIKCNCK